MVAARKSVLQALKEELNTSKPRQAIDKLSENAAGIFGVGGRQRCHEMLNRRIILSSS